MHLQKEIDPNRLHIKSYQPGQFNISDEIYAHHVLIDDEKVSAFKGCDSFSALSMDVLQPLIDKQPEVLLIGCGASHQLLPLELQLELEKVGAAVEVMATREACHTFEILSYERRRVVALLFAR